MCGSGERVVRRLDEVRSEGWNSLPFYKPQDYHLFLPVCPIDVRISPVNLPYLLLRKQGGYKLIEVGLPIKFCFLFLYRE